jgi:hypothetical protein
MVSVQILERRALAAIKDEKTEGVVLSKRHEPAFDLLRFTSYLENPRRFRFEQDVHSSS